MKQDAIWDYFQNDGRAVFQHSRPRLRYLARQLTPGQRVLNIGVGGGVFEEAAIARGLDVHCVDPSERAIEELRSRLSLGDKARVGRGQSIPFSDASFDAIVVSEVMEHLADDALFPMVREIGRVLGPGGLLLGTVPSCEDLTDQQVVCPDCSKVFHRWGHVR
ncbi:MAG: class I SAM-dependent methyltransferase, partial [Candidatus Wallbacteria bacterium]|nr:class I SAM-dependent methyltransferase [Candidatus Wallbacteria bacterium]